LKGLGRKVQWHVSRYWKSWEKPRKAVSIVDVPVVNSNRVPPEYKTQSLSLSEYTKILEILRRPRLKSKCSASRYEHKIEASKWNTL
jgi:hypothetical protein